MLTDFYGDESKKKFFLLIFFSKWPTLKNWDFQLPEFSFSFLQKFHKLVFGFLGLIDGHHSGSIYMAERLKNSYKKFIFGVFWLFLSLCQTASQPYYVEPYQIQIVRAIFECLTEKYFEY